MFHDEACRCAFEPKVAQHLFPREAPMPVLADQTLYSGSITLFTLGCVALAIAVAVVHDYRNHRAKFRKH